MDDSHENPLATWLEDAWLERYLDRGLTEAETAWFEAYMLDKPRLIAAIDTDTALRDGLHAWHAQQRPGALEGDPIADAGAPVATIADRSAQSATSGQRSTSRMAWFRPLSMAAAIALAALLGASAARWMVPVDGGGPAIASPNRIVFDTLRGSANAPLVDRPGDTSAPLLIDIAVPMQATAVVAHFSDQSSVPLPVSADGFVSLTGPRDEMLARSPIRIAWMLDGQPQERHVDVREALGGGQG